MPIGQLIGMLIAVVVGIIITVIGWLIWKKEKISLMHAYRYANVSEENKTAFCKLSGIGLVVVGVGVILTAVVFVITESLYSFLCFAVSIVIGMALVLTAGRKYNR